MAHKCLQECEWEARLNLEKERWEPWCNAHGWTGWMLPDMPGMPWCEGEIIPLPEKAS